MNRGAGLRPALDSRIAVCQNLLLDSHIIGLPCAKPTKTSALLRFMGREQVQLEQGAFKKRKISEINSRSSSRLFPWRKFEQFVSKPLSLGVFAVQFLVRVHPQLNKMTQNPSSRT
jgi:hypothetical protein